MAVVVIGSTAAGQVRKQGRSHFRLGILTHLCLTHPRCSELDVGALLSSNQVTHVSLGFSPLKQRCDEKLKGLSSIQEMLSHSGYLSLAIAPQGFRDALV